MKFLSSEVGLYLYKPIIQICMGYRCHVWASAPKCYLDMLDKDKLQLNAYVGLLFLPLIFHLKPWFIVKMQPAQVFSIGISLVDVHLNWLNGFHFLILMGGPLVILTGCKMFLSTFLDCQIIPSFFPRRARFWKSVSKPLSFDLRSKWI